MKRTSRNTLKRGGLVAAALLLVSVAAAGPSAAAQTTIGGQSAAGDALVGLYDQVSKYSPADYTANSWESFSATRNAAASVMQRGSQNERAAAHGKLQGAADGLVMVRGLKSLVADYKTRAAARYTGGSWAPFAKALDNAERVAADGSASA
ncbi:hypothetical protein, partial [Allorhizocola rhizosphaerae]|uniref:hypothetical protein n=1 Tax=Allorhizocola rhizosphaerae TaxID=1872709 RepID=UPI001B8CA058